MNSWLKTLVGIVSRKDAEAQSGEAGAQVGEGERVAELEMTLSNRFAEIIKLRREVLQLRGETERLRKELVNRFPVVTAEEEAWTVAHQEAWLQFLKKTEAGQVLLAKVNFQEQAMNRSAVLRTEGAENNTGFARGWHAASQYFFKALPISADVRPQQDEDTDSGAGAAHLRERLAP